ncbi:MAG: PDZ domain-containing protein [Planctomycetota bacterium]
MNLLRYSIGLADRARGELTVELTLPPRGEWELALPRWTPGSYVFRDFARHLMDLECEGASLTRPDPHRVRVLAENPDSELTLRYRIYARELTVRTAFASHDWVFWNGACVYLWPTDRPEMEAEVSVALDESSAAFEFVSGHGPMAREGDRYALRFEDHDDAVDTPILGGGRVALEFTLDSKPVRFVEAGDADMVRWDDMSEAIEAILGEATAVFGGGLPIDAYHFLSLFAESGRGGLEHLDSSTLLAPRTLQGSRRERRDFLGLIAHEFFHLWNVKRMRPSELWQFDYYDENPTRLLWVAEGFTAYFDDLCCVRAGAFDSEHYLERLAEHCNNPWADTPLGDASLEAWTKLYKGGENLRNNSVNYYVDGALAGLVLDVTIRLESGDQRSLEDLMRELYRTTFEEGRGYTIDDVVGVAGAVGGPKSAEMARRLDHEPVRPLVEGALQSLGVKMTVRRRTSRLGVRVSANSTEIASVVRGGPAWNSGLRAGDEVLAIDGLRVRSGTWRTILDQRLVRGLDLNLLIAREGRVLDQVVHAAPEDEARPDWKLTLDPDAKKAEIARRQDWLAARRSRQ